ncbi:MAG: H-type lectin domain-containing protein [Candidatus Kerfeldbacteria bacterium]|nr:H-type lectin domain-containing protein [Candidatus Kerfeldbacteria bacterium]
MKLAIPNLTKQPAGILLVELIITMAVFAVLATGAIYFLTATLYSSQSSAQRAVASHYLQEGLEAVQQIDQIAWNYLADLPNVEYGLAQREGVWELVTTPDHPEDNSRYTRTIIFTDVYRDTAGDIVPSTDDEATFDPHTRGVTVTIAWENSVLDTSTISADTYVTDWIATSTTTTTASAWANGTLTNLRISAIADGELQIIQSPLEIDNITINDTWQTFPFDNTFDHPVVLTAIASANNPNSPVTVRVRNITATGFDIKLDFPTDNTTPSTTNSEIVTYLAIEPGIWELGDGATKLEAGVVEDVSALNCQTCGSWNRGTDITYQHIYSTNPIVFHQIVTDNDSDWITSFVSDDTSATAPPGIDGFQVALNGAEVVTVDDSHGAEDIAYLVIERERTDSFEHIKFETDATGDTVRGFDNTPYRRENFDQTYFGAPLVLATQMSMDATDGSWGKVTGITASRLDLYVDEDQTNDAERSTTTEDMGYMAFAQPGTYYLNDADVVYDAPPFEVGVVTGTTTANLEVGITTASTSWSTVNLTNTYTTPVVVATIQDGNNPATPVTVRVRNATVNSFEVRLDIPPDNFNPTSSNAETVNYLVVEAGVWRLGNSGIKLEAGVQDNVSRVNCFSCGGWNNGVDVSYTNGYSAAPVVLHQVMSEHDSSWITSFVSDDTSATAPPGTDGFQVALNGAEVTASHEAEDIGYVVIEAEKTATANSVAFETDTTGDIVRGFDDTHYTDTFDHTYITAPIVLAAQTTSDATEGSWAMLDSVTPTQVTLYADEDQTRDRERSHTSEDFSYLAFGQAGSFTLTDNNFLRNPVTVNLAQSYTNPVVITSPWLTSDTNSPVSTRVYDVTSTAFTVQFDFPTDNFSPRNTTFSDQVYYLVMEEGDWQIGDMKIEAHRDTSSTVASSISWTGDTKNFNHHYSNAPIVLHQVMSRNDPTWISSWVSQPSSRTNPPTRTSLQIAMNAAQVVPSRTHGPETIGWIAFENIGTGVVDTTEFRTMWNTEFAGGHSNGCYNYSHGGNYANARAVVSQMSMDNSDGSWAALCNITTTDISMHFEEDQYSDSERSHQNEAVGAVIFADDIVFPGAVDTSHHTIGTYQSEIFGSNTERNYNIIEWFNQIDCSNCTVSVQLRTADTVDNLALAGFVGPDGTTATIYSNASGDLLSLNSLNQRYLQYVMTITGTTAESPKVEATTITLYER